MRSREYLGEFVERQNNQGNKNGRQRDRTEQVAEPPHDVTTIFRGPHIRDESKRSQQRYSKKVREAPLTNIFHLDSQPAKAFWRENNNITFSESDTRWVHHPHNNALVVTIQARNNNVYYKISYFFIYT